MRLKFNKQTYETKIIKSNLDLIFPKLEDELKNTQSKITYVCKEHGEYSKRALELFNGKGCSKCGYDKSNMKKHLLLNNLFQNLNLFIMINTTMIFLFIIRQVIRLKLFVLFMEFLNKEHILICKDLVVKHVDLFLLLRKIIYQKLIQNLQHYIILNVMAKKKYFIR